jgi:hypothetical protein
MSNNKAKKCWSDGFYVGFSDPTNWEEAKTTFINNLKKGKE